MSLRLVVSALVFVPALVAGPVACGDDEGSGTTGKRIALDVKIASSPESRSFTNAKGWTVVPSKAAIATGAFYFYDGDTLFASRTRSFVKAAHAHPGHYVPGNAKGEMLAGSSADLLTETLLGSGAGVSGFARSATFTFGSPGVGPAAGELGDDVIVVEGSATKGAEARSFRAEVKSAELLDAKGAAQIEGCPFTHVDMQADGVVTVTVKLTAWFDQVDFTDVPAASTPVLLPDALARNQLVRGMKEAIAYAFSYAPR